MTTRVPAMVVKPAIVAAAPGTRPLVTMAEYADQIAMRLALPVGLLTAVLIYVLNLNNALVPHLDEWGAFGVIGALCAILGTLITSAVGYAMGTQAYNDRAPDTHDRSWWRGVIPVALTYMLAAFAIASIANQTIEGAFRGLELGRWQAVMLGAGFAGAIVFSLTKQAILTDAVRLLRTAIIVLAVGIYITASNIDNAEWWRVSFSYLGSWDSSVHWVFNMTLIVGGLLLLFWASLFVKDLATLERHDYATARGFYWYRIALYWVPVAIAFVGFFKTRDGTFNSLMHNLSAYSLAAILGAMMVALPWAVPKINRDFRNFTLVLTLALGATLLLSALKIFNTVGLEVISFGLGIVWLQMFVGTAHNIAARLEPEAYPQ